MAFSTSYGYPSGSFSYARSLQQPKQPAYTGSGSAGNPYGNLAPKSSVPTPAYLPSVLKALNPSGTSTFGWTPQQGASYLAGVQAGQSQSSGPSYLKAPVYDWQNDPYLLEAKALAGKNRTQAEAEKNDQLRKMILQTGLGSLAEKLFPQDTAFIQSVKDNPFSQFGQIGNTYEGTQGLLNQANESLNQQNLFFSSNRTGEVLPQLYRQRQQNEYDLGNYAQNATDTINAAYTKRLEEIQQQELEASRQAWMNAMMSGMYGGGPSGGGETYNALGQVTNDLGTGVGRPGEWADLPVLKGWDPNRNSDAQYDMTNATPIPGGYMGPQGQIYDEKGRVR